MVSGPRRFRGPHLYLLFVFLSFCMDHSVLLLPRSITGRWTNSSWAPTSGMPCETTTGAEVHFRELYRNVVFRNSTTQLDLLLRVDRQPDGRRHAQPLRHLRAGRPRHGLQLCVACQRRRKFKIRVNESQNSPYTHNLWATMDRACTTFSSPR